MRSVDLKSAVRLARQSGVMVTGGINGNGWKSLASALGMGCQKSKGDAIRYIAAWLEHHGHGDQMRKDAAACVPPSMAAAKLAKKSAPGTVRKSTATICEGVDVTSTAFLSTYAWRRVRMLALKKYGARCQCCGASPATGAVMNVDHIKPRRLFPDLALDLGNLQVLCHDCNHGKGNWDQTDWRDPDSSAPEVIAMLRDIARNG